MEKRPNLFSLQYITRKKENQALFENTFEKKHGTAELLPFRSG